MERTQLIPPSQESRNLQVNGSLYCPAMALWNPKHVGEEPFSGTGRGVGAGGGAMVVKLGRSQRVRSRMMVWKGKICTLPKRGSITAAY